MWNFQKAVRFNTRCHRCHLCYSNPTHIIITTNIIETLLGRKKVVKSKTSAVTAFEAKKAIEKAGGPTLDMKDDLNLMSMIILI